MFTPIKNCTILGLVMASVACTAPNDGTMGAVNLDNDNFMVRGDNYRITLGGAQPVTARKQVARPKPVAVKAKPAPKMAPKPAAKPVRVAKPSQAADGITLKSGTFSIPSSKATSYRSAYASCASRAGIKESIVLRQDDRGSFSLLGLVQTPNITDAQYAKAASCMNAAVSKAQKVASTRKVGAKDPL